MAQSRLRHYLFPDKSTSEEVARKIGTNVAWVFHAMVEHSLGAYEFLTLVCIAAHEDMCEAAGRPSVTYSRDIADMTGFSEGRSGDHLRLLKTKGLIMGTPNAGYSLANGMSKDGVTAPTPGKFKSK